MVGATRLFIGGLPISKELDKKDLLPLVNKYAKDIEIIRDSEGYCKGFAYINVSPGVAHSCISELAGKPFQKGLLRVEEASEPFMDRLRREWGEQALSVKYTFPSTPSFTSTTPFTLDTSAVAGSATPAKKVTKLNGDSNNNNNNTTATPSTPTPATPVTAKSKKELKQQAFKEKSRLAEKAKKEAKKTGQPTPKRKADELEEETEAPVPAEFAPETTPVAAPPKKANGALPKQGMSLNLGDDDESTPPVVEAEPEVKPQVKTPAKKAKTENNKNNNNNNNNNNNKNENKNQNKNKKENNNNKQNNNNKATPSTPTTPAATPAAAPVSVPSTPVTPGGNTISGWDMDKVHSWATDVAGDELADKLKAKGVKGRKLVNWRDTYNGNPNGLRKQISEFLQIPENLEADADDLSSAILRLA